jgi:Ca2+-binding RTX toxin-like protein
MGNFFGNNNPNTFTGTADLDNMFGQGNNDILRGKVGDDRLNGGLGHDLLDGGTGNDTADYSSGKFAGFNFHGASAGVGVKVNLGLVGQQNTVGAGSDTLISIENVIGTNFADTLTGNGGNNVLLGLGGVDKLFGGGGTDILNGGSSNDTLNGGAGSDTAFYADETAGVKVNLQLQGVQQNTVGAGLDTLVSIENIIGTTFSDTLTGNGGDNRLRGLAGNDHLIGHGGNDTLNGGLGDDILDGGSGNDTADYSTATAGVTVSLVEEDGQATGGAGIDTLVSIKNVIGSKFNDTLSAFLQEGTLDGGGGNDLLEADLFLGTLNGGAGNDTLRAVECGGILNGGDGNDRLRAEGFDGTLNGGAGNDTIEVNVISIVDSIATVNGGAGADRINLGHDDKVICDYNSVSDSPTGAGRDVITGFDGASGDRIDLTNIPVTNLSYVGGILNINTDFDAAVEMQIQLIGAPPVLPYIIT